MNAIQTGIVNHLTLTVSDLERTCQFYTNYLGFQVAAELSPSRTILSNGSTILVVSLPPDPSKAIQDDTFDENRVGLDHLSFSVPSLSTLEEAARLFDEHEISHGEIKDLGEGLQIYVMAFRDPDNIQLELTASYYT